MPSRHKPGRESSDFTINPPGRSPYAKPRAVDLERGAHRRRIEVREEARRLAWTVDTLAP